MKEQEIAVASQEEVAKYAGAQQGSDDARDADAVAALTRERDELKDKLLRAQAECANIAKRLHQQHSESLRHAGFGLARAILPVVDNFERTLANLPGPEARDPVADGVRLIADQLKKILKDQGVEPIEALGQPFDPTLHEAMMQDAESNQPPGTVTAEYERGYKMHDRVLRHSRVAIAASGAGDADPHAGLQSGTGSQE